MYKARNKRTQRIRLFLTYTIVPVLVVAIVGLLVMYMLGYRFSSSTQQVTQGGLIQFGSYPTGASVQINDRKLTWKTNTRLNSDAGMFLVTMQKDGYRSWQKTVFLEPGRILWLDYARLVPTSLSVEDISQLEGASKSAAAIRKDTVVVIEKSDAPQLTRFTNLSATPKRTTVRVPSSVYTAASADQTHLFELVEMAPDAKRVLLRHKVGDMTEWLLVDLGSPERSANVSKGLTAVNRVFFDTEHPDRLYFVANGNLVRQTGTDVASRVRLVSGITAVSSNPNGVVSFIRTNDDGQTQAGYVMPAASSAKLFTNSFVPGSKPLHVVVGIFAHRAYAAIVQGKLVTISQFNPNTGAVVHDSETYSEIPPIEVPDGVERIEFSPDTRFIAMYAQGVMKTYDLEIKKLTATHLSKTANGSVGSGWLDNHTIWTDASGKLTTYEFDGQNSHEMATVATGQAVVLSENNKYLYFIRRDGDKLVLVRVKMTTD